MMRKNSVPGTTQVCFYEMYLRVTVELKVSYLVSKKENGTRQNHYTQTSFTQSVILVREQMSRASFLLPAEMKMTSMSKASTIHFKMF